jgi:transposase-like protein
MTTQRKSYSRQFKIDAVKLVTDRGYKISEAARNLEIKAGLGGGLGGAWGQIFLLDIR